MQARPQNTSGKMEDAGNVKWKNSWRSESYKSGTALIFALFGLNILKSTVFFKYSKKANNTANWRTRKFN